VLVRLGLGLRHNYLLEVRGRKSGRVYSTPVNVLDWRGRRWLVAGRGRTQWVQNAELAGEAMLRKGRRRVRVRLRPVPAGEKPEILSAYLDRFRRTVQRYFPVKAGSNPGAFVPLVGQYPVFELLVHDGDSAQTVTGGPGPEPRTRGAE
jgi:deazaflavin-dependent oxidoreductase (nitroreductase family)